MTTEQKAKAYDEAIKRAQKAADSGMVSQNFVDDIFQLREKESEDERIRKSLVEYFSKFNPADMWDDNFSFSQILAYLEKQKEPIDPFDTKLFQDGVKEGRRLGREDIKKEQKPITTDAPFNPDDYKVVMEGNATSLKQKEQKPAEWSEEDDALLKEIVSFFKDGTVKLQHDLDLYAGFLENKLKSLRPQPKQECKDCKEYEKGYQQGHQEGHTLGYNDGYKKATEEYNKHTSYHFPVMPITPSEFGCDGTHCTNPQMDCINCPRTTIGGLQTSPNTVTTTFTQWKPSEEQLTALSGVCNYLADSDNEDAEIIESLYRDLEKLI